MAWRPPKQLFVFGTIVEVRQVTAAELKDLVADHDDETNDGAWRADTNTIYLLKSAPWLKKNRTYWHEISHMLTDCFDRG